MKKVLIVFGTRPEAIKMAPLVLEMKKRENAFSVHVCVTGQHRLMLDQVLSLFSITPDYDLNIMAQGQDLYDVSSRVLLGMREILSKDKPDLVLVHGDTTTSTFSAIAAFYERIPVGHVEAGLRTGDIYSPWPEEINRQLTARLTAFHFSPTETNKKNLLKESIPAEKVWVTGNTVIDALLYITEKLKNDSSLTKLAERTLQQYGYQLEEGSAAKKIILVTGHRRENHGQGFVHICTALKTIAEIYPDLDIVYPVHLNPNVRKPVSELLSNIKNVYLIEPLEYIPFILLMSRAHIILTDSGGIQEEAPSLGKPVLVMRNTTERPEALSSGGVKLIGTEVANIYSHVSKLMDDPNFYNAMAKAVNPYGDGLAAARIADILSQSPQQANEH